MDSAQFGQERSIRLQKHASNQSISWRQVDSRLSICF